MKISDVIAVMEEFAPERLSFGYVKQYGGYDNCGLLVGSRTAELTGIVLCLDVTAEVIDFAEKTGANLVVSHHPFIYSPLAAVTDEGNSVNVMRAVRVGLSVYCAHLNLDIASGGVNDTLARVLGITDTVPMFEVEDTGLGRIGKVEETTLGEFRLRVRDRLGDGTVWASGNPAMKISTVALIAGGGGGDKENVVRACQMGADVFLSSEFKHNVVLLAEELGLCLVSASHYAEEKVILPVIESLLKSRGFKVCTYEGKYPYLV